MKSQNNEKNLKDTTSDELIAQAERIINEKYVSDKMAENILMDLEIAIIQERIRELDIELILLSRVLGNTDSDFIKMIRREYNM